jgi:hypothetical protein
MNGLQQQLKTLYIYLVTHYFNLMRVLLRWLVPQL